MKDFSIRFTVDSPANNVFDRINDVSKWWTQNIEGNSKKLNDEFAVRFGDVHYSKQKLIEVVPGKRVVWLVTESKLNFLEDREEWNGTKISFDISKTNGETEITFTHHGLRPEVECFGACSTAWSEYVQRSLYSLIKTGEGQPSPKENDGTWSNKGGSSSADEKNEKSD